MTVPIELICVVLLISAIISSLLGFHAWQRRRQPGALWLSLLMVAVAEWSMAGLFEIIVPGIPAKIAWSKVCYLGIATVAPLWFLFAYEYTQRGSRPGPRWMIPLWAGAALILAMVFTNELHGLVWARVESFSDSVGPRAIYKHGPAIWLVMAYVYGLLLSGAWLVFRFALGGPRIFRRQAFVLVAAALVPWVVNVAYIVDFNPLPGIDLTPVAFTITGLLTAWGIFGLRLFELMPVAHNALFAGMRHGAIVIDPEGRVVDINPAAQRLLGVTAACVGAPVASVIREWALWTAAEGDLAEVRRETRLETAQRWIEVHVSPLFNRAGDFAGRLAILGDITERHQAEESRRAAMQELDQFFTLTLDLLCIADASGHFRRINPQWTQSLGYEMGELQRRSLLDLVHKDDLPGTRAALEQLAQQKPVPGFVNRLRCKDGAWRWVEWRAAGLGGFIYAAARDITERREAEERLVAMSRVDPLTGLCNRAWFEEQMRRISIRPAGIILCDVDGLKLVNDTLGHSAGDALLRTAAGVIGRCFRSRDVVARIGGDEFAILLAPGDDHLIESAVRRMRAGIAAHNARADQFPVHLSIGHFCLLDAAVPLAEALREADARMYQEKITARANSRNAIVRSFVNIFFQRQAGIAEGASRLRRLVDRLAARAAYPPAHMADLRLLVDLHDIGNIAVPDAIMHKTGPLTEEERGQMRLHCEVGRRIADAVPEFAHIADLVLNHHEHWDGHGYPGGLKGEAIPMECRILAVCEAYAAMVAGRPWRAPMPAEAALAEVRCCAGAQFDPRLAALLAEVVAEGGASDN
jgi:diguanylate cyclase (GGDEF)-like protein/PAS domain S-box-containing protein